jgi:hypothetical protein
LTLIEARIEFTRCLTDLLHVADIDGHDMMIAEVVRDRMTAEWNSRHCRVMLGKNRCERTRDEHPSTGHEFKPIGIAKSVHCSGLAVDLYIIENKAISNDEKKYASLGAYWKSLHPLARWGGDFEGFPDLGHFSFTWEGRS